MPGDTPDPDRMFQDGNRVRFQKPVDAAARRWWLDSFHTPHGLTPEGMADLLTRSVSDGKSILYRYIDGDAHTFALRVEGRFSDGGSVWFVERSLNLDGSAFSADAMFIPDADARAGRGRRLMGDLMHAAELLGLSTISVEAERIGRYAWLRAGFLPDRGSWRSIQIEAMRFIQRHFPVLGSLGPELLATVASGTPSVARSIAMIAEPVPSRELFDGFGQPRMLPFGKTFFLEASPNWTGEFRFDPESRRLAAEYIGQGSE